MVPPPPVALVHEPELKVIARFDTIRNAERAIEQIEVHDAACVHAGDYGIDAPEEMQ